MITRRVTFKLYPSRQQCLQLHYWRRMHCNLYARPEKRVLGMVNPFTQGISLPCPYVKESQTPASLEVSNETKRMQATKAENLIAQSRQSARGILLR